MAYRNLILELYKKGISEKESEKRIAIVLGKSKKTVHKKFNCISDWTLSEMNAINKRLFDGQQSLDYLFVNYEEEDE